MRKLVLFTLLIVPIATTGQVKSIGTFLFSARNHKHAALLVVKTKAFARSKHNLIFADQDYLKRNQISLAKGVSLVTKVDGHELLGTDGEIPRTEFESMSVSFSGKKILVPRSLYADCFNPNLGTTAFVSKLSDAGDSLLVFMAGSDGAGGYQVMWILRNDGHHSRFVNNCSDCDYAGILDFFSKQ